MAMGKQQKESVEVFTHCVKDRFTVQVEFTVQGLIPLSNLKLVLIILTFPNSH